MYQIVVEHKSTAAPSHPERLSIVVAGITDVNCGILGAMCGGATTAPTGLSWHRHEQDMVHCHTNRIGMAPTQGRINAPRGKAEEKFEYNANRSGRSEGTGS